MALFWGLLVGTLLGSATLLGTVPGQAGRLLGALMTTGVAYGLSRLALRRSGRGLSSAGLALRAGSLPRLLLGLALGGAMFAAHVGLLQGFTGALSFARVPEVDAWAVPTLVTVYLALSAMEEVAFRGWCLRSLQERYGTLVAQVVVALAFALYHRTLAGYSWRDALVGTTLGSLLWGTAALTTGGLAVPIGMHAAWNIGAWCLGDKPDPGPWRIEVEPGALASVRSTGAWLYVGLFLGTTAGLWLRARRARRRTSGADGAHRPRSGRE